MAADFSSVSPSPSRDQDVFGKELRLSGELGPILMMQRACTDYVSVLEF